VYHCEGQKVLLLFILFLFVYSLTFTLFTLTDIIRSTLFAVTARRSWLATSISCTTASSSAKLAASPSMAETVSLFPPPLHSPLSYPLFFWTLLLVLYFDI